VRFGFRISELLSLKVGDVLQHGKVVEHVSVARAHMKKKTKGRTVPLHPRARAALWVWLEPMSKILKGTLDPKTPVFCSRVRDTATGWRRAVSPEQAWRILVKAYKSNELTGKRGTHNMGKTFANRIYDKLGKDLVKCQRALGYRNINSTVSYLSFREEDITEAILAACPHDRREGYGRIPDG
jgi:site-specific recombinase XerD